MQQVESEIYYVFCINFERGSCITVDNLCTVYHSPMKSMCLFKQTEGEILISSPDH